VSTLPFDVDAPASDATLSTDGLYRYWLGRRWSEGPVATFVMLNPSTADASADDPTIRRCVGFSKAHGAGGLDVVNLYALRSTDPKGLWIANDPVGPLNDMHLYWAAEKAAQRGWPIIAAWGANARADRVAQVCRIDGMDRLAALGVTKDGAPRHPLYLRADAQLTPWPER
jgi:hypothetical protein